MPDPSTHDSVLLHSEELLERAVEGTVTGMTPPMLDGGFVRLNQITDGERLVIVMTDGAAAANITLCKV